MDLRKGRRIAQKPTARKKAETALALKEAFDLFYGAKKAEGMRETTLKKDYIANWGYFLAWLSEQYPEIESIQEISASTIRDYVNYLSGKVAYSGDEFRKPTGRTLSPYTIENRVRPIRTLFNFLSTENMLTTNPFDGIKAQRFDKEDDVTFSDDDVRKLLAAPDTDTFAGLRDRTLMLLLADSGLRINEALRLTAEHFDVKTRCLQLPGWMNKNRKPRVVPLSPECTREVLGLINENRRYFDTDHIFVANYGEPLKDDHFRKRLKEHATNAGVDLALAYPHQFRSYFITTFLLNGGDLFTLQRIVAHASIETTRRYARMNDEHTREQHTQFSPLAKLGITRVGKRKK
jgi:integrase/recombinase XerD